MGQEVAEPAPGAGYAGQITGWTPETSYTTRVMIPEREPQPVTIWVVYNLWTEPDIGVYWTEGEAFREAFHRLKNNPELCVEAKPHELTPPLP